VLHCIEVAEQSRSAFDARDAFERGFCASWDWLDKLSSGFGSAFLESKSPL